MTDSIKTPRGEIVQRPNGTAELVWSTGFAPKWNKQYSYAQKWLDNEVLMDCEPYTPLRTSMLIKSGTLGTDIGSGTVQWIAPYARYQYYSARKPGSEFGALRGPYWFERAKAVHKNRWITGAARMAGSGT